MRLILVALAAIVAAVSAQAVLPQCADECVIWTLVSLDENSYTLCASCVIYRYRTDTYQRLCRMFLQRSFPAKRSRLHQQTYRRRWLL